MNDHNFQTTEAGIPVPDNQNSMTAGEHGPVLLQDHYLLEKMALFNRERVPERVVHAKGAGAFGYFEVTADVTQWTKARFLDTVGKRTPALARFSTVAGEKGAADSVRDPRGFALKFYTEEGNYDLVGNNTPVFFIRDPMKFSDFIHTQKRMPQTNLRNPNVMWDFWSLSPESLHQVTVVMSDRGTPKTHRNMNGYGSHTFKWVNRDGQAVWIKYHFKTEAGIDNWTGAEADAMAGQDPDYATRDLFEHIEGGNEAVWRVEIQVMPLEDAYTYRFNPFDVTKVWPHADYPVIPIGRLVLNRNPQNYFAEIEQAAFEPSNMVPGIEPSPDKMLQGRLFSYADAHRYRIGTNYNELPVNRPMSPVRSYARDGAMRFGPNGGSSPNYEPNSFGGPVEAPQYSEAPFQVSGIAGKMKNAVHTDDNDFIQPGNLYRIMTDDQKARLIDNIVTNMAFVDREIQARQIEHFRRADAEWGARIAQGLDHEAQDASEEERQRELASASLDL